MALASLIGGQVGVSLARRLDATALRVGIVCFGVVAAAWLVR